MNEAICFMWVIFCLSKATATYASSFALVVLSFDRAEAVINPLRSTKKTCFGGWQFVLIFFLLFGLLIPLARE